MSVSERVLTALSRDVNQPEFEGGTARTNVDNALSFLIKTVPGFADLIRNRDVLDFGCGYGIQAIAMVKAEAHHVVGIDLPRQTLEDRWKTHQALGLPNLELTTDVGARKFDVVVSCSSFEHFSDPADILRRMREFAKPGGLVVVSFAEPWLSPRGSHCDGFTRLPWVNVLFPEASVMKVRSRYKNDGATRYEDIEGGLNRMTVAKFERLMRNSGMNVRELHLFSTKGLPVVTKVPVVREFLTSAASCILENP